MKKLIIGFLLTILIISIAPQKSHAATFSNQDVTAYVGGGKTYHGTNPRQYYTVAVGPKTCGNARSGTLFPFGSDIVPTRSISTPGGNKTLFNVEDMGNVNCTRKVT